MDKILEILEELNAFAPIKISINGIVLYNDYDSKEETESGAFGEIFTWQELLPTRLKKHFKECDNLVVTGFELKKVHNHHSIINIFVEKVPKT